MYSSQSFLNQHAWKLALTLGLLVVGAIVWGRGTTNSPAAVVPTEPAPAVTATRTPAPVSSPTPDQNGLIPTLTPTLPPPTQTPTPAPVLYQVQPGDIPLSIAAAYSISVDELLAANTIADPTELQIGEELRIPVTATPSPTAPTPTPTRTVRPSPTPEPVVHTIEAGDTLLAIAAKHDSNMDLIMLTNQIIDPSRLSIGQEIIIPVGLDINPDTPTVVHEIKSGDTFNYLSFFYGSTIDDILAANPGLDPRALQIGQQVIIPVTSKPINPKANPRLPRITTPEAPPETLADLQTQMLAAINNQRATAGLPAYQSDAELVRLALAHAQDMVNRGYFSHTTPEGITLDNRFVQNQVDAGYTGENIHRNLKPIDKTVAEAIRWWMSSTVHRSNILHSHFNKIGIGVAEGPPEWYTFVLVFAER